MVDSVVLEEEVLVLVLVLDVSTVLVEGTVESVSVDVSVVVAWIVDVTVVDWVAGGSEVSVVPCTSEVVGDIAVVLDSISVVLSVSSVILSSQSPGTHCPSLKCRPASHSL